MTGPEPLPVPSMAAGTLSRRRRNATIVAAVALAVSLVMLFNDDIVGDIGAAGIVVAAVLTLLLGVVVLAVLVRRRGRAVVAVVESGRAGDALWATGVQTSRWPGHPTPGRPVVGVLAITPHDVRLVPGPAAEAAGCRPCSIPLPAVLGMQSTAGFWNALGGGHLFVGLRDGSVLEFVGDGRGLGAACRRAGIAVAGIPA